MHALARKELRDPPSRTSRIVTVNQMSDAAILFTVLSLLAFLLAANAPVALALAASGALGITLLKDYSVTTRVLGSVPFDAVTSYSLVVIPMFVLLGMFALRADIARDVFGFGNRVLKWLPGGLGVSTIATCAGFAAVTGSSVATVATLARMTITEMQRYGYNKYFAAGIIGAGGTLGVLIPPSIILVIYGILTRESIGQLLIAGIIPGIISALAYALTVVVRVKLDPSLIRADNIPNIVEVSDDRSSSKAGLAAIGRIATLFTVVIGGIYSGIFTATESGAVAAFAALLFFISRYRRSMMALGRAFLESIQECVTLTAMSFTILIGAGVFSYFLVVGGIPSALAEWVAGLNLPPTLIVLCMVAALIPLGMFLDSISIVVITVPLLYEPITRLGYDGLWLGVIVVKLVEIGLLTPPVGLNAFVAAGAVPGLSLPGVFRGLVPFVITDLVVVALLFAFPGIVTWLPLLSQAQ